MKLERIFWRDIGSISDSWYSKDELIERANKDFHTLCETVGYIVFENSNFVVVAATLLPGDTEEENRYHDASMIMQSVIVTRENLVSTA
jgi:hypothetical protein